MDYILSVSTWTMSSWTVPQKDIKHGQLAFEWFEKVVVIIDPVKCEFAKSDVISPGQKINSAGI